MHKYLIRSLFCSLAFVFSGTSVFASGPLHDPKTSSYLASSLDNLLQPVYPGAKDPTSDNSSYEDEWTRSYTTTPSLNQKSIDTKPFPSETVTRDPRISTDLVQQLLSPKLPKDKELIAQAEEPISEETAANTEPSARNPNDQKILINFNNVSMIEYIRFVSRVSGVNFVFDEEDLQFNVTIVSEEPTSVDNIVAALLQELQVHELIVNQKGNTVIIHKMPTMKAVPRVVEWQQPLKQNSETEMVTRVFLLNTVSPDNAAVMLRPLLSVNAIITVLPNTNHLVVTDITSNVEQIEKIIKSVDSPESGLVIGQYAVVNGFTETLISLTRQMMLPIAQDQPLTFIPHAAANSVFIVSTPFLVERAIAIMEHLDRNQGATGIFDLKSGNVFPGGLPLGPDGLPVLGKWRKDDQGNMFFDPLLSPGQEGSLTPPKGKWQIDNQGNWFFQPGDETLPGEGPNGQWKKDANGKWVYQLAPNATINATGVLRPGAEGNLPFGNIRKNRFLFYKIRYRKGDEIVRGIQNLAGSLESNGTTNGELISTLNSVQWLEASNVLVFTGPPESLQKTYELAQEVDTVPRQVFIEMLILETDIDDSLDFSVNFGSRFGGGNTSGSQAFLSGASSLAAALDTSGVTTINGVASALIPSASSMARSLGYNLGIIGQKITHNGTEFSTIGALVRALHDRTRANIIMNPKIITEDRVPAEIFVGINTQFPTQSIANNLGSIITQNFEFRDVGTDLKVTPFISPNGIITLEITQEISSIISGGTIGTSSTNNALSTQVVGPTTSKNKTTTRVHVPDSYFLVISGMIHNTLTEERHQVPCLGGIPFLGAAFSDRSYLDVKRNLMIFMRPQIIETPEQIQNITRQQQFTFEQKNKLKKNWELETEETLNWMNILGLDPDRDQCMDMDI